MTPAAPREGALPRLVWIITAAFGVAVMVFAACCPFYATDTLARYAPMAEAFAVGNWAEAFHPRFGVGMPVVSGLACWLGLDGLSACAAVSSLAWALGAIPLWMIADRIFDRRTAWVALLLYLICPQAMLWGLKGLREPFKIFGSLLSVAGVLACCSERRLSLFCMLVGTVFLMTFKPDGILLSVALLALYACLDRFGRNAWIALGAGVLVLQPMCWLTWLWTGYWVPSTQYVKIVAKLIGE